MRVVGDDSHSMRNRDCRPVRHTSTFVRMLTAAYQSLGRLALYSFLLVMGACDLNTSVQETTPADAIAQFASKDKLVVTFVGFSGAQYENPAMLLETAERLLQEFDPSRTIINGGATAIGIGAIYPIAKRAGFVTTGIVSTQARKYGAELSPSVDHVFYIEDASWGGFIDNQANLSPTSTAMVQSSDVIIAIGGGEIARDEIIAARRLGKEVRYIPADLNHQIAREKAKKNGLPEPTSFAGAVGEAF